MKGLTVTLVMIFFLSSLSPFFTTVEAENSTGIEILDTVVNPANNHTYHLLSASSWEDAADAARGLNGFLSTVDDAEENQWLFDTFASFDNQSRHLWIGLSDHDDDGYYMEGNLQLGKNPHMDNTSASLPRWMLGQFPGS